MLNVGMIDDYNRDNVIRALANEVNRLESIISTISPSVKKSDLNFLPHSQTPVTDIIY